MGLNDQAQEGTFVCEDGSPVNVTNWQRGEPNNVGGNEDSAQLNRFNPAFTWNDEPCSEAFPYVCESF